MFLEIGILIHDVLEQARQRNIVHRHVIARDAAGRYWDTPYSVLNYGDAAATKEARPQVVRYYSSLLTDALWLGEHDPNELSEAIVATSRPPGDSFHDEKAPYERTGLKIEVVGPRELLQLMARTPEHSASRKKLRPYQETTSQGFREALPA